MKWNFDYLKSVSDWEAKKTMEETKQLRSDHRITTQGKTPDKTMRHVMKIPLQKMVGAFSDPYLKKLFNRDMDVHERKKALEVAMKRYPEYCVVDRY